MTLWPALAAFGMLAGLPGAVVAQGPRAPTPWPRPVYRAAGWPTRALFQALVDDRANSPRYTPGIVVSDSTRIRATHWKTGALIGGGLLGVLGVAAGAGMACYDSPCRHPFPKRFGAGVILGSIGFVTGFGVGALIGGQLPARGP